MRYEFNIVGVLLSFLAIAILFGAFGGSGFERGAAALLTMLSVTLFPFNVEGYGRNGALFTGTLAAVTSLSYIAALVMMITGL